MYEILQAFEMTKSEKNPVLRTIYMIYVRHKLKTSFFQDYKARIHCMPFDKNMIEEFNQFFNCTKKEVYPGIGNENPFIHYASSEYGLAIKYGKYFLKFITIVLILCSGQASPCTNPLNNTSSAKIIPPHSSILLSSGK